MKVKIERRSRPSLKSGFTLLEMVIVLGIIALILGTAIGLSGGFMGFGREVQTEGKLQRIDTALRAYRSRAGHYPSATQGLNALVEKPTSTPQPRRWDQSFKNLPKDAWDNEFEYKYPGNQDPNHPEIISKGKDGQLGTDDDLSSQDPR
jgi:general secretion pathway protein G